MIRDSALQDRLAALGSSGRFAGSDARGLGSLALERAAEEPDRVVVRDAQREVTRGEMVEDARRLAGAMLFRGIEPGAVVGFQLPNWWEACVINLAASLFGYRLVPLLTIYRTAELTAIVEACGIEAIFVPESFRGIDFPAMIGQLPSPPPHVFTVRGESAGDDDFGTLLRHEPAEPRLPDIDDVKTILFTSGSTGRPKGVAHSHGALDALIRKTGEFWNIGPDDRFYVPSPIAHIGGSIYVFDFPWITGCTAELAESWDPDEAVRAIEQGGITFMAGATPFLSGLIAAAERAGTRLPSLRRFICGGASVPPELVTEGLSAFENAVVSRAYGSTEVPLVCPGVRDRLEAEKRAATDGQCAVELRILDDHGAPVPDGQSGEIVVRAPQMLLGYLDEADEKGSFTEDGFFLMGDLGRVLDGNFVEITGRKKDIIIRKGENISPLEIENALARHPAVRQTAVVGAPDPDRGEIVVAFVVTVDGRDMTLDDIRAHLGELGLAKQKCPERLHVVGQLPVNSVGKVQKVELRAMARGESALPGA